MPPKKRQMLEQVSAQTGIEQAIFIDLIQRSWIAPVTGLSPLGDTAKNWELDEEDIARAQLILELRRDFGVNDEAMPIILHLLDELYAIRARLIRLSEYSSIKAS